MGRYRWISLLGGAVIVVLTYFPIIFVVSNSLKTGRNIFSSGVFSLFTQFDYQNCAQAWSGVSQPLLNTVIVAAGAILVTINVWGDYLWPVIVIQDPHRTTISAGVQQFVGSFGLNVSSGGAVFAAFVIATLPMFVLVGFTMRYFVSGLTEGALKL